MTCPKCGNEVSQEEIFCGQCGTSNPSLPQLPERPNPPATSGLLGTYGANPSSPFIDGSRSQLRSHASNINTPSPSTVAPGSNQPFVEPLIPNQLSINPQLAGLHTDATEAMTALPSSQGPNYSTAYPPQHSFP